MPKTEFRIIVTMDTAKVVYPQLLTIRDEHGRPVPVLSVAIDDGPLLLAPIIPAPTPAKARKQSPKSAQPHSGITLMRRILSDGKQHTTTDLRDAFALHKFSPHSVHSAGHTLVRDGEAIRISKGIYQKTAKLQPEEI